MLVALFFDALIVVPVLVSTRWFFPADCPEPHRQHWLWATAGATALAALAGLFNPLPPVRIHGPNLGAQGAATDAITGTRVDGASAVNAPNGGPEADVLERNPDVLRVRLQQAEAEAALLTKRYEAGLIPVLEVEAAKEKVEILKAELQGDNVQVARVSLAGRRAKAQAHL